MVHLCKTTETNKSNIDFPLAQVKLLEEKNTVLMQTNVSLEEELRKANATKGQLETYKRQVPDQQLNMLAHKCLKFLFLCCVTQQVLPNTIGVRYFEKWCIFYCLLSAQVVELQNRLSEESKKADKMEFEYKRLKEKVDSLQKEKDVCTFYAYFQVIHERRLF